MLSFLVVGRRLSDYVAFLTSPALPKALGYRLAEDYTAALHDEKVSRRKLSKILLETASEKEIFAVRRMVTCWFFRGYVSD